MVRLAIRQLHADLLRSALTIVAIAAVIAVILVLRGFEQGLYQQSRDAVMSRGADLFVVQAGVQNFVAVRSSLRQLARRDSTFSMANSVAFVSATDLEDMLNVGATVSYMLVDAEAGIVGEELTARIEAEVEKVNALTQEEFIDSDFEMAMKMGVEIISFMTILGSALAAAIIAFTTFVQVSRRFHELAVAKAIGVSNFSVYVSVVLQSLTVTGIGYLIAIVIAAGAMPVIAWLVPEVIFLVSATSLMRMAGIALGVAMLAALAPARLVASVEPASAFEV